MRRTDLNDFSSGYIVRYDRTSIFILLLTLFAVFYNAILAVISAHIVHITSGIVVATEVLIALAGTAIVAINFAKIKMIWPPFLLFFCVLLTFPLATLMSGIFVPRTPRDVYLISLFFLLGCLVDKKNVVQLFRISGVLTFIFMVIEAYATPIYVAIFQPADYFLYSRGIGKIVTNKTGLFGATLGFQGRFDYGIFHTHRLGSLFLEQVSLANFSIILMIFLCSFWGQLRKIERLFYVTLILFIVVTTNSRTASSFLLITTFGYFVFPLIPRYINALFMPLILAVATALFFDPLHATWSDDLPGRVSHTVDILGTMPVSTLLFGAPGSIDLWADAGFAYIIGSQTVFGLLALWLFLSFGTAQNDALSKRYSSGLIFYIFIGLLVGASVFTIKVAAPSWLVAGFLYQRYVKLKRGDADPLLTADVSTENNGSVPQGGELAVS